MEMNKTFEVKTAFLYQCILELPFFEYGCLAGKSSQGGEEAEAEREATDKQHLSNKPPFIRCGETYCIWQ